MKKYIALFVAALMLCPVGKNLSADNGGAYAGGNSYIQARNAPKFAPAAILALILAGAIIAVAVSRSSNEHNHAGG